MWREAVVLSMIRFPDAFGSTLGRVGELLLHGGHDFRPCFDLRLAAQLAPFFRRRQLLTDQSTKAIPHRAGVRRTRSTCKPSIRGTSTELCTNTQQGETLRWQLGPRSAGGSTQSWLHRHPEVMQGRKGCKIHVEGRCSINGAFPCDVRYGKIHVTSPGTWNASLESASNIGFGFPKQSGS